MSGLRQNEVLTLRLEDIDFATRQVIPKVAHAMSATKRSLFSFFNEECEQVLKEFLNHRSGNNPCVFVSVQHNGSSQDNTPIENSRVASIFRVASAKSGVKIMHQMLRDWSCEELGELGLTDRHIDFFCGRTPRSVLATHYSDYAPRKMQQDTRGATYES